MWTALKKRAKMAKTLKIGSLLGVCLWWLIAIFFWSPPLHTQKSFGPFTYGEKFWPPFGPLKKNWSPLWPPEKILVPTHKQTARLWVKNDSSLKESSTMVLDFLQWLIFTTCMAPIYCTDAKEINNSKIVLYLVNKLQPVLVLTVVLSVLPFYVTMPSHSACMLTALWIQRMWFCIEYSQLDLLHNFTLHEKGTCTVKMFISLRYSCQVLQSSLLTDTSRIYRKFIVGPRD